MTDIKPSGAKEHSSFTFLVTLLARRLLHLLVPLVVTLVNVSKCFIVALSSLYQLLGTQLCAKPTTSPGFRQGCSHPST